MHVLFVHENLPAQFKFVAPWLARDHNWRVSFAAANPKAVAPAGVEKVPYVPARGSAPASSPYTRWFDDSIAHALGVYDALKARTDINPDLIVSHSGLGSSLFLPHLYDCPIISFFEYFHRVVGQDVGYRPEDGVSEVLLLGCDTANATILLDLHNCERGWSPSEYQRGLMPAEYQPKIEVIPEGVDASLFRPRVNAGRRLPDGTLVPKGTRIVTYVSRGFEKLRGFDVFMEVSRRIDELFPNVLFVVVGSDRICYGSGAQCGGERSFRERVLKEGDYDLSHFRFTGRVPEADLAAILSISDLHIYLTHPFVTSWSMLDAMNSGRVVLASGQACTREYISHGVNGLLCDFFDADGIARQAVQVLRDPDGHRCLGAEARRTIEERYALGVCLPRIKAFFDKVMAAGKSGPSLRAALLVRPATAKAKPHARPEPLIPASSAPDAPADVFDGSIPFRVKNHERRTDGGEGVASSSHGLSVGPHSSPKRVLFCWELGGGLGHLMQMLPLAEDLVRRGHRVFVALRQLERAAAVFGRAGVAFLQAPCWAGREEGSTSPFPHPITFGQLLQNVGFGDEGELFARACAWRNLFQMVRADLIVFDHSPTALLASRGLPAAPKRAEIGSGFCCPPDDGDAGGDRPWAVLRPPAASMAEQDWLIDGNRKLLRHVNRVLDRWKQPGMERLGQLYADVDENFLTTFPELDHFARRVEVGTWYWGPVVSRLSGEAAPRWPDPSYRGPRRRLFVYLKASHAVRPVLERLGMSGWPTVAYVDRLSPHVRRGLESPTLRISARPVDLATAAAECDAAVLGRGHGATAEMLLAGKPVLEVPSALEQRMTGAAVTRLGLGEQVSSTDLSAIVEKLNAILEDQRYTSAARDFADRYAAFDSKRQRAAMLGRAEELLGCGADVRACGAGAAPVAIAPSYSVS